jgi:2-keto-4-pentenoate hydratase/2-oxohepta-3-ene-1,7-dioic acid hydratase in catechol pathway
MKPMQFLKAGDVVRVEVEKLGYIENRVVPEKAETIIG